VQFSSRRRSAARWPQHPQVAGAHAGAEKVCLSSQRPPGGQHRVTERQLSEQDTDRLVVRFVLPHSEICTKIAV
jgi:hypothetical protein